MLLLSNLVFAGNKLAFFFLLQAAEGGAAPAGGEEDFSLLGMIRKMAWPAILVAVVL